MSATHSTTARRLHRKIRLGRWAVLRTSEEPDAWTSVLWGGDGEHPMDGAYWPTWEEARDAAIQGWYETRENRDYYLA